MARGNLFLRRSFLAVLFVFAAGLLAANPNAKPNNAKEAAPRFHATTTSGEKFTNESIKGKVVLFEFWTTWCGYCDH